jgi:hypothetical protein
MMEMHALQTVKKKKKAASQQLTHYTGEARDGQKLTLRQELLSQ